MSKSKTPAKTAGTAKPAAKRSTRKPKTAPAPAPVDPRAARLARWQAWSKRPEAIEELCEFIAGGGATHNLNVWCETNDFNYTTVLKWLATDKKRQALYDQARDLRADAIFDEIVTVANEPVPSNNFGNLDSGAVADKRLRIDTLKWMAGRLAPKRYGDKVQVGGAEGLPPVQQHNTGSVTLTPSEAYMKMIGGN